MHNDKNAGNTLKIWKPKDPIESQPILPAQDVCMRRKKRFGLLHDPVKDNQIQKEERIKCSQNQVIDILPDECT